MKTIILILVLVLPTILIAQQTYVPDDYFEQALIDQGYDLGPRNDSVPTANIDTVTTLIIDREKISDLTGIEDFIALRKLYCGDNDLISLDVSYNTALIRLHCGGNDISSLDLSNNAALEELTCFGNELTSLDLSNNAALWYLNCYGNKLTSLNVSKNYTLENLDCAFNNLTSLDLSNNAALERLHCYGNDLTSLDIKNGNNKNMTGSRNEHYFYAIDNPDLDCIQVDDSSWSANAKKWEKDALAYYSEDCGYTGIDFRAADESDNISISSSPNPFSKSTTIKYTVNNPAKVRINVYDVFGNEVATLLNEFQDAGTHKAQFNTGNLPQGIYFYKIQIDNATESGKLLLIK